MRVLLTGATGALGRRLLPMLLDAGHEVVGTTRTADKLATIRAAGADAVVMDGLDAGSVAAAVDRAAPDAVVHQMTALAGASWDTRDLDADFESTNRLRAEGTDHLLAAGRAAGVHRFLVQSYAGWPGARTGAAVLDERAPLESQPAKGSTRSLAAIAHLERVVPEAGGLVLRYGSFYGPGTAFSRGSERVEAVARRAFPVVGSGAGRFSFCHVDDAAAATLAALTHGSPGVYNVVDDEPAPVAEWLPHLARLLGARPPRRVPAWLARPLIGELGVRMMTQTPGYANTKAKEELGWRPAWPTWRAGFAAELAT